jgi:hypothetical protein
MYTPSRFSPTLFRTAWRSLVLGVALLGPSCALAQSDKLTLPIERAIVSVTPAVAAPNTPRTVTVNGMWHDACVPGNPSLEPDPATNALIFKLYVPQTLVACAQALTPYQEQQTYTPTQGGVQRIVVLTNDGRLLGEGQMITQAQGKAHSLVNLTGEWHAADSMGSGLFLTHNFTGSDTLLGGWFYYDNDGAGRWGSLQLGTWVTPTVFEGTLLEFHAAPANCGQVRSCPRPATSHSYVANVRIDVVNDNQIIVEAHGPTLPVVPPPPPNILFRSVMTREAH